MWFIEVGKAAVSLGSAIPQALAQHKEEKAATGVHLFLLPDDRHSVTSTSHSCRHVFPDMTDCAFKP